MERSFGYDGVLVRPQKKFAETDYTPYYTSCNYLSYNKISIAFFKYLIYVFSYLINLNTLKMFIHI